MKRNPVARSLILVLMVFSIRVSYVFVPVVPSYAAEEEDCEILWMEKEYDQYYLLEGENLIRVRKGGRAKVAKAGKTGYIDKTGKVVVPLIYDNVDGFYNELAIVSNASPKKRSGALNMR